MGQPRVFCSHRAFCALTGALDPQKREGAHQGTSQGFIWEHLLASPSGNGNQDVNLLLRLENRISTCLRSLALVLFKCYLTISFIPFSIKYLSHERHYVPTRGLSNSGKKWGVVVQAFSTWEEEAGEPPEGQVSLIYALSFKPAADTGRHSLKKNKNRKQTSKNSELWKKTPLRLQWM